MLTGGGDVDPALYGETPHGTFEARRPDATRSRSPWRARR